MPIAFACSTFSVELGDDDREDHREATAPPIPWTKRPAISIPWLVEAPQKIEAAVNRTRPDRKTFLRR